MLRIAFRRYILFPVFFLALVPNTIYATSYNSSGQVGLINLPSAETKQEQSIFLTLTRNDYQKLGTLTVTPFPWLEASYFYYRPDDLLWESIQGTEGLFLDKGFNVKFSYKPNNIYLPRIAIGLDDFAGTGQFTKEYVVATYVFNNNIKLTSGIGWGKFVGDNSFTNPLNFIGDGLNSRPEKSENYSLGGNPSYDKWFRGDATFFGGFELPIFNIKGLTLKLESDPFDYFKYGCCEQGLSENSSNLRKKESDFNYSLSYKYKDYGNVDLSFIKGNTINLSISLGFSSKKNIRKKKKFIPVISNTEYGQDKKNEFYLDLLENLNSNDIFLQTADIKDNNLSITVNSPDIYNPIQYSSRASYIAKKVSDLNDLNFDEMHIGLISRGAEINNISYRPSDLENSKLPQSLLKRRSTINQNDNTKYKEHEFQPKVLFPVFHYAIEPDMRAHIGSPQRFLYYGIGVQLSSEIQLNRNLTLSSSVGQGLKDNFDKKLHIPSSAMEEVRTEILLYLQKSDDFYLKHIQLDNIWPIKDDIYGRVSFGYLEEMFGGISSEFLYKPFNNNFSISYELNYVKKRDYDGRLDFLDYSTITSHINVALYEPNNNILVKWSYGKYLAKDKGYTLDLSRRMPSGWHAGFYFSRTNVSAETFGEGSFDKGFYFKIPYNILSRNYSKRTTGFSLKTMTRDGGQKLNIQNRLIDSFYGSTFSEIDENWDGFLN